jgi:hypothetical protein
VPRMSRAASNMHEIRPLPPLVVAGIGSWRGSTASEQSRSTVSVGSPRSAYRGGILRSVEYWRSQAVSPLYDEEEPHHVQPRIIGRRGGRRRRCGAMDGKKAAAVGLPERPGAPANQRTVPPHSGPSSSVTRRVKTKVAAGVPLDKSPRPRVGDAPDPSVMGRRRLAGRQGGAAALSTFFLTAGGYASAITSSSCEGTALQCRHVQRAWTGRAS